MTSTCSTSPTTPSRLVAQPGPDNNPRWSPDGKRIVFSSAMGNPKFFHANSSLAVVSVEGGAPRSITDAFDQQPGFVKWNADGIYFGGMQKTASHLFRVDPETGRITRVTAPDNFMAGGSRSPKTASRSRSLPRLRRRSTRSTFLPFRIFRRAS